MEIECVLLLSAHCKCVVPFYESTLSRPKWSAKSALSLASHKRKGAVKLYSAREELRSAVLHEVLNGTNHLRSVGVLVVVPRHDLDLVGVVVATLVFRVLFVVVPNFETTVTVPQRTVVVLNPACSYHHYTTFQRYFQVFLISFSGGIFMRAIAHILIHHPSESPGPRGLRRGVCPTQVLSSARDLAALKSDLGVNFMGVSRYQTAV